MTEFTPRALLLTDRGNPLDRKIMKPLNRKMPDHFDEGYSAGERSAATAMMRSLLDDLRIDQGTDLERLARLVVEREEAIAALRSLCRAHGDLDWEPSLHLADILDKHLGKHLEADLLEDRERGMG